MGQYFKAVNVTKKEFVHPHDYDNGMKMMEHSYVGNNFVTAVQNLLLPGNAWHKCRIVWAGDYSDLKEEDFFIEQDEVSSLVNQLDPTEETNLYKEAENYTTSPTKSLTEPEVRKLFLVNHSKRIYIEYKQYKTNNLIVDPLPILTSHGNGLGGGDYHGSHPDYVGTWAGDIISMEFVKPESFKNLKIEFKEDD